MLDDGAYLNIDYSEGNLTVGIVGEVDHHSARVLREKIDRHMYMYRPTVLKLSLAGVNFMDSSGLGLILGRLSLAGELGCKMILTDVDSRSLKILSLAGVGRLSELTIIDENKKIHAEDMSDIGGTEEVK